MAAWEGCKPGGHERDAGTSSLPPTTDGPVCAGDRSVAKNPTLDTAAPEVVWGTYMRTTLRPPLAVRVRAVVPRDFHVSVA